MLNLLRALITWILDHSLSILSGLAAIVIAELLYLSAWLSTNPRAWQYDLWAALVVVLWAQPWSSRDRYRTDMKLLRMAFFGVLFLAASASAVIFNRWQPGLIGVGIVILFMVELTGRRAVSKS